MRILRARRIVIAVVTIIVIGRLNYASPVLIPARRKDRYLYVPVTSLLLVASIVFYFLYLKVRR